MQAVSQPNTHQLPRWAPTRHSHAPRSTAPPPSTATMARGLSQARLLPLMLALRAVASPLFSKNYYMEEPERAPIGSASFWWKIGLSAFFVLLGGSFSGYAIICTWDVCANGYGWGRRLTLGLMGLDELHLRVLATSSDSPTTKKNAKKVMKLLGRGKHWVLVVGVSNLTCMRCSYVICDRFSCYRTRFV